MNLHINTTKGEYSSIQLSGEIDVHTAPKLKKELLDTIDETDNMLIVDMDSVSYMDSSGLGVFISALKACKEKECQLKLIKANERIYRLFQVTGIDTLISVEMYREER